MIFNDLLWAHEAQAPQFADWVVRFVEQPDPPEDRPEDADGSQPWLAVGKDAWTLARLQQELAMAAATGISAEELKNLRNQAFDNLLNAPYPPPRLRLGKLLIQVYEGEDPWGREQLFKIFARAKMGLGIWQAFKTIYKQAEKKHDAGMFGVLAYRLDVMASTPTSGEISGATYQYMRRRAWRYLRLLGQAVPELYPEFAIQVLRHYPADFCWSRSWIASQIWAHADLLGKTTARVGKPPQDLDKRAYPEAWKLSAIPLLRLVEDAQHNDVADFAIRCLKKDFPDALRTVDVAWLKRLGQSSLRSVHGFVAEILTDSPRFHQSKLQALGLDRMVVNLLRSGSPKARGYALAYVRSYLPEVTIPEWLHFASKGDPEVQVFAVQQVLQRTPEQIGLDALIELLIHGGEREEEVATTITSSFSPADLSFERFFRLVTAALRTQQFVEKWYASAHEQIPTAFYLQILKKLEWYQAAYERAVQVLSKRKGAEIGMAWFKEAIDDVELRSLAKQWLEEAKLSTPELDVAWVKRLVQRTRHRRLALGLLNNTQLIAPKEVGVDWLLSALRHPDQDVQRYAHLYLLEHFAPQDFADDPRAGAGIDRLYDMVSNTSSPEAVRRFAVAYLTDHHPEKGAGADGAGLHGIPPRLALSDYLLPRIFPLFTHPHETVRKFAVAIGRSEIVRWGDKTVLYTLAQASFREPRSFALDTLLTIGQPHADPAYVPKVTYLDATQVFGLAESIHKSTRETALALIRNHYDRLGGMKRLAWLMESPHREVRLASVRLLWNQHQGRSDAEVAQTEALRMFLRTVLFGVAPGRMPRREGKVPAGRALPASVAKRRLLGVVRHMALEQPAFAQMVVPVLGEFRHSLAKGEWQACVASLAHIRHRYPELKVALPEPVDSQGRLNSGQGVLQPGETAR